MTAGAENLFRPAGLYIKLEDSLQIFRENPIKVAQHLKRFE